MAALPNPASFEAVCAAACAAARRELASLYALAEASPDELRHIAGWTSWRALWRIEVRESRLNADLWVAVPARFPYALPKIFLAQGPVELETLPHIDSRKFVCTFDSATVVPNPADPRGALRACVERAIDILARAPDDVSDTEYLAEFHHYWPYREQLISTLSHFEESRNVSVGRFAEPWAGYAGIIAEDADAALRWSRNAGYSGKVQESVALFLPVKAFGKPPYPATNKELAERLTTCDPFALRTLERFLARRTERPIQVVAAIGAHPILCSWCHHRSTFPLQGRTRGRMHGAIPGFRKGHHPSSLELRGYGASTPIERAQVDRADSHRLRWRTIGDLAEPPFAEAVVVGLGSVGSQLADALCRTTTFEQLTLCDSETLSLENVPRHLCGFDAVGRNKAEVVADLLAHRAPEMRKQVMRENALDLLLGSQNPFGTPNLVVLALGATSAELALLESLHRVLPAGTPIVSVWVEPGLAAGHVVNSLAGSPGCLGCLIRSGGVYQHAAVTNPGDLMMVEPGCSPGYAPYGAIDLSRFIAEATNQIIRQSLSGSWSFRWVGDLQYVIDRGGRIAGNLVSGQSERSTIVPLTTCSCCGWVHSHEGRK